MISNILILCIELESSARFFLQHKNKFIFVEDGPVVMTRGALKQEIYKCLQKQRAIGSFPIKPAPKLSVALNIQKHAK